MARLPQLLQEAQELSSCTEVELGTWLIQDEVIRLEGEDPGERDPLQLTVGEGGDLASRKVSDPKLTEGPFCPLLDLLLWELEVAWAEGHVLGDGVRDHLLRWVLEEEAHTAAGFTGCGPEPIDQDLPGARAEEADDQLRQGRLPGAVGAEEEEYLPAVEF